MGNPLLTPTYSHNFDIRSTFFNNYTWGAGYTTGASTNFKYFSVENSNITYSVPVTDGKYKSLNSYIAWNPHAKDYSWMANVRLSYSFHELHNNEQTTRSHSFAMTLNGDFKLWKKYSLYISGIYQSPYKSFNSKKGHSLILMPSLERKFDAFKVRIGSNYIINATTEVKTDSYRMKISPKWNNSDIYLELSYNIEWGNKRAFIRNTVESTISETDRMTK